MATTMQRPAEAVIHARVSPQLRAEFEALARRNHRSLAGETRAALERHVKTATAGGEEQRRV